MRFYNHTFLCYVFIASFVHLTYADNEGRLDPIPVQIKTPSSLKGTFEPFQIKSSPNENRSAGTCPSVSVNLSGSDFGDGQYIMQAGFAEGESLGATYYISPDQFPIKIDLIETIFATYQTTQQTTTHYAVTVWDGTPDEGIQVASFSSDDVLLPHLVMPAGTGGMHLSFAVDPDADDVAAALQLLDLLRLRQRHRQTAVADKDGRHHEENQQQERDVRHRRRRDDALYLGFAVELHTLTLLDWRSKSSGLRPASARPARRRTSGRWPRAGPAPRRPACRWPPADAQFPPAALRRAPASGRRSQKSR